MPTLSAAATATIEAGVDDLFARLRVRLLGPGLADKSVVIAYLPELSIPGVFGAACRDGGVKPDDEVLAHLINVAGKYIDAVAVRTKAKVLHDVASFLGEAAAAGVKTDLETVLGGRLTETWRDVSNAVNTIVDAEVQTAKNTGILDGIIKINRAELIEDPVVFFVVVRDSALCSECRRLHLLDDGVTPRLWYMSEVGHDYHKRGEDNPKIMGLHPHCRCSISTLLPGYGFTAAGMVTYIGRDHDEMERQRGLGGTKP